MANVGRRMFFEEFSKLLKKSVTAVTMDGKIYTGNLEGYDNMIRAKFRNETQSFPDALKGESSTLPSLYEFRFFLDNSETRESWFNFSISSATFSHESCLVNTVLVNEVPLSVNVTQRLNPITKRFSYQLFFELWLYDSTFQSFRYHGRFVSIWLHLSE